MVAYAQPSAAKYVAAIFDRGNLNYCRLWLDQARTQSLTSPSWQVGAGYFQTSFYLEPITHYCGPLYAGLGGGSGTVIGGCNAAFVDVNFILVSIGRPADTNKNGKIDDPDNEFCFSSTNPGVLQIACAGGSMTCSGPGQLRWAINDIGEIRGIWSPHVPGNQYVGMGNNPTVTFTGLPIGNSAFGRKKVVVEAIGAGGGVAEDKYIEVFFDRDAKNHPGEGMGTTPNWFYYWKQTPANYGSPLYDPRFSWDTIDWRNGQWVAIVVAAVPRPYVLPPGDPNAGEQRDGIDLFAWICRHEGRHVETSTQWYPNGYNPSVDMDQDWIPDSLEESLGGTQENPKNGGPFVPGIRDSDGDGMRDDEDYTIATQCIWKKGSADQQDWSKQGRQRNR